MKRVLCFSFLLVGGLFVCVLAEGDTAAADDDVVARRSAVAESMRSERGQSGLASAQSLLETDWIPVDGARVVDAMLDGDPVMAAQLVLSDALKIAGGERALALSTGRAATKSPAPGTVLRAAGTMTDSARAVLTLEPDRGRSLLFVTWNLFSTELPGFSRLGFDDLFSIYVTDSSGRRRLLEVRASDPRMYPVSGSRAAGSGFDLFAPSPDLLPARYGTGEPAAVMSGWRTTGFAVDASGPIQLEIEVLDAGDGLMDTQALIQKIALTAFIPPALIRGSGDCVDAAGYCEALFPLPGTFTGNGNPQDPPWMCEFDPGRANGDLELQAPLEFRGPVFQSIVADGVTRMPIIPLISQPRDEVVISVVSGNVPADGGLGSFGSFERLPEVTLPVTEITPGQWGAQVQYFAPESYWRPELDLATEYGSSRMISLSACFQNADGSGRACANLPIGIARPDLILMHGLWSDRTDWELRLLGSSNISTPVRHDYQTTNASSFSVNRFEPQKAMFDRCVTNLTSAIFGAQFDYAGHSMGGLLARVYLDQAAPYKTIHRLFTLNTPHLGSELANLVVNLRDNLSPLKRFLLILAADRIGRPIHLGAIDDLAVGSDALMGIPDTRVLSHALVGVGGTQWAAESLRDSPGPFGDFFRIVDFLTGPSDLFESLQHDLVVSRSSQIGGLPAGTFTIFDGLDSIHGRAPGSPEYSDRLFCQQTSGVFTCPNGAGSDLINAQGTGSFSFIPAPSSVRAARPNVTLSPETGTRGAGAELTEGGIRIAAPAPGQPVAPGGTVQVRIESVAPFMASRVLLLSRIGVQVLDQPPFEFTLSVPDDHAGALEISAIGEDAAGNYATAEPVTVSGQITAALTNLILSPGNVFLNGFDDRRQLTLTGEFADGVERDLTDPSTGTMYSSSDSTIVSVSGDGILRPHKDGVATIIVGNGELQDSITVEVMNFGDLLFRDNFEAAGFFASGAVR